MLHDELAVLPTSPQRTILSVVLLTGFGVGRVLGAVIAFVRYAARVRRAVPVAAGAR